MLIKKNTVFEITHSRKGRLTLQATKDFDTEFQESYPVKTINFVEGMSTDWEPGEKIPCKKSLCSSLKIISTH